LDEIPLGQCLVLAAPQPLAQSNGFRHSPVRDAPGGTGKTQLALHLATDWLRGYPDGVLVWISAASRDAVLSGYAWAAQARQGAPVSGAAGTGTAASGQESAADDAETAAARYLSWLSREERPWLVVFDGLSDPADVEGLWPTGPSGRVLVTTQNMSSVPDSQRPVTFHVGPFSPHEALTYLMARLSADPDWRLGAVDLVDDLACDPMALAQASAAIAASGVSCRDYRELFTKRREELTAAASPLPPAARAVTWTLSVECADEIASDGATQPILVLAALLGSGGIPEQVFASYPVSEFAARRASGSHAPDLVRTALASLRASGLLHADAGVVHVHPVVRAQVLAAAPEAARAEAARTAGDALMQSWPEGAERSELACALRACAASLEQAAGDALWAGQAYHVLFRAGHSLDAARLVGPAVGHWRTVAAASERRLGAAHEDTLLAATRLASAAHAAGRGTDAVAIYQRVLDTQVRQLGPEHPRTVAARADFGMALLGVGQPAEAVTVLEGVIAIGDRQRGVIDVLAVSDTLAAAYQAAGRQQDAMRLIERNLAERERRHGPDDPQTIRTRRSLALACLSAGKNKDAMTHGTRALAGAERVLGADHPDTLDAMTALASAQHAARRLKDAIALYERALASLERVRGADAPETIGVRGNLASAYHSAGRLATALEFYERTRADCQRVLGPDHPDTLAARTNLAHAHYAMGRVSEATAMLRSALADCERALPANDPLTEAVRESLETMSRA
jgi:tetratricopeptide (TPR) repeat protein